MSLYQTIFIILSVYNLQFNFIYSKSNSYFIFNHYLQLLVERIVSNKTQNK